MRRPLSTARATWFILWPCIGVLLVGLPLAFGFWRPDLRDVAIGLAIGGAMILGLGSAFSLGMWTKWSFFGWILLLVVPCLMLMIGTADAGPDTALEHRGETVQARVTDVHREQRTTRDSDGSSRDVVTYTYSFERLDGGPDPGTVVYRGRGGYEELHVGATTELLVDPDRELPTALRDEVDSSDAWANTVVGAVWWLLTWIVGTLTYTRRRARHERWGTARHDANPLNPSRA